MKHDYIFIKILFPSISILSGTRYSGDLLCKFCSSFRLRRNHYPNCFICWIRKLLIFFTYHFRVNTINITFHPNNFTIFTTCYITKTNTILFMFITIKTNKIFSPDERLEIYSRTTVVTLQRGYGSGVMRMNFLSDGFAFLVLCFV